MTLRRIRSRARERGAAMILVLWTFAVLSVLAAQFARAMRQEAQAVLNFKQQTLGHYTAIAGMNEAILAILTYNGDIEIIDDDFGDDVDTDPDDDDEEEDDTGNRRKGKKNKSDEEEEDDRLRVIRQLIEGRGDWVEATFNGQAYEVRVYDESGKIPINANDLEEESLVTIMENLEYDETVAQEVAAAILDWRDEDDLRRNHGAETDYYEGLDPPYRAKNAPFDAVEELLLVKGVTHEMFYGNEEIPGFVDLFSVLSTRGQITENSISLEVEQALCGILEDGDDSFGSRSARDDDDDEEEDDDRDRNDRQRSRDRNRNRNRDRDRDRLGMADGETIMDVQTCIENVGLSARRSDRDGKPNLTIARIEARVKNQSGRVVAHLAATVRFKGDGFQTYQWYDAVFDDDEGS